LIRRQEALAPALSRRERGRACYHLYDVDIPERFLSHPEPILNNPERFLVAFYPKKPHFEKLLLGFRVDK